MPAILYSIQDPAGVNIAAQLRECHGFAEGKKGGITLVELSTPTISSAPSIDTDLLVFASRHKSASGKPCLTVHAPGNWGKAEAGGNDRELALTSAKSIRTAHSFLAENPLEGFDVFREATHHGPTSLKVPCLFVEVGSSENEWKNGKAVERISECVEFVCNNWRQAKGKVALGLGGGHYCPAFGALEEKEYAFSHIAAKYALDVLDEALIRQAISKTVEPVELAVIDWKGCKAEQRTKLIEKLDVSGLKWIKA